MQSGTTQKLPICLNTTTDSYIRQYLRTCQLERSPLDNDNVVIVGYNCYIFELNRFLNAKCAIFGLCH